MFTQFSIPVVHPAFELLKKSARLLHFIAASVVLVNAWHQLQENEPTKLLAYTQLIIAADIYLLIFFGGNALVEAPRLNLAFRFIESLALLGIGVHILNEGHTWLGMAHLLMAVGYGFLFFREWRVIRSEAVGISPTGITLPNFIRDAEISWADIKSIAPHYQRIIIKTISSRTIQFTLRKNLNMQELEQIDEFCQKHLRKD